MPLFAWRAEARAYCLAESMDSRCTWPMAARPTSNSRSREKNWMASSCTRMLRNMVLPPFWSLAVLGFGAVFARGHAHLAGKDAREIVQVVIPHGRGHIRDGHA